MNATSPTAPTYSDVNTGAINEDLLGSFYVIAADVDPTLEANQIKLATSRTRALANDSVDVVTAGTAQSGGLLDLEYRDAAWGFEVMIKGKTSNVIEANNGNGASVNTLHLPGSLQKATEKHDFQGYVRQLTDPSASIGIGGNSMSYFASANVDDTANTLTISRHGLQTRDKVTVQQLPSATRFGLDPLGTILTLGAVTQDSGDYTNGTYTSVVVEQGSGTGAIVDVVIAANAVSSVTLVSGGANYVAGDSIRIPKSIIGGAQHALVTVDDRRRDRPLPGCVRHPCG